MRQFYAGTGQQNTNTKRNAMKAHNMNIESTEPLKGQILAHYAENPDVTAEEMGRRFGVGILHGRRYLDIAEAEPFDYE